MIFSHWERERLVRDGRATVKSTAIHALTFSPQWGGDLPPAKKAGHDKLRMLAAAHEEIDILRTQLGRVTQDLHQCRDQLAKEPRG